MSLYRIFVIAFIVSAIALAVFMYHYVHLITDLVQGTGTIGGRYPQPVLRDLISPGLLASGVVLGICSLLYRVLGIVFIARNPLLEGGEKVAWILGFVLLGFITGIVFIATASSRALTATESKQEQEFPKY